MVGLHIYVRSVCAEVNKSNAVDPHDSNDSALHGASGDIRQIPVADNGPIDSLSSASPDKLSLDEIS